MHSMKKTLYFFLSTLRNVLDPLCNFREVGVLCYHSIGAAAAETTISSSAFAAQLAYLHARGHAFVSLAAVAGWMRGEQELPQKAVALTFDDGYRDFLTTALPILERLRAPATVFVVGDAEASRAQLGNKVPLLSSADIRHLRLHPLVEVGYHSLAHADVSQLHGDALVAACAPRHGARLFAYPGGVYSSEAIGLLPKLGYRAACSIKRDLVAPGADPYMIPRHVVLRSMSAREVAARMTQASRWYRACTSWVRRRA